MLGHIVPILCGNGDFQDIYDEMYPEAKGGLFFVERYADDRDFNKEHHLFVQVGAREIERSLNLSRSLVERGYMIERSLNLSRSLVERGYMVRFMEDNTRMSVDNLTQLRDRIIKESGAHFYHSNFVGGWTSLSAGGCGAPSNYTVELTNAKGQQLASACNPVTSHKQCFKPRNTVTKPQNPITQTCNPVTKAPNSFTELCNPITEPRNTVTKPQNPITQTCNPVTKAPNSFTELCNPITEPRNTVTKPQNPITQTCNPVTKAPNSFTELCNPITEPRNTVTKPQNPITQTCNPVTEPRNPVTSNASVS
eukprot:gene5607-2630_t